MKKKALIWIFIAAVLVLAAGLFLMCRAGKDGDGAAETPTQAAAPQTPESAAIGGKIFDAESETVIVRDAAAEELRAALERLPSCKRSF